MNFMDPMAALRQFGPQPNMGGLPSQSYGYMPGQDSVSGLVGTNVMDYANAMPIAQASPAGVPGTPPVDWLSMEGIFGKEGKGGWGNLALNTAQGIGNLIMGLNQYGLAKDAFNESKRQFGLNYNMQRNDINRNLEDRQAARVASNAGAYESVGDYMKKYRV